mgnify:CR=1 FL=1
MSDEPIKAIQYAKSMSFPGDFEAEMYAILPEIEHKLAEFQALQERFEFMCAESKARGEVIAELKAAVRWINSHAYIEGDLDSHCQGVIDEAEESSSDADKAHAQTLLKVLEEK